MKKLASRCNFSYIHEGAAKYAILFFHLQHLFSIKIMGYIKYLRYLTTGVKDIFLETRKHHNKKL